MEPILIATCNEPEATITRSIYPVDFSISNLHSVWEKARPFKNFLNEEVADNFGSFVELFVTDVGGGQVIADSLLWRVDDFVGLYYLTDIREFEATAHFTFFDRRFRGRLDMTKQMLKYVFDRYGFQRLNVYIPMYAKPATETFVRMLGFLQEGRKRKAVYFHDDWFDIKMFGLLRSELK